MLSTLEDVRTATEYMVGDIMSTGIVSVRPSDTLTLAIDLMSEHGIRHLLITDEENTLLGVFSERDVWRHLAFRCHVGNKFNGDEPVSNITITSPISIGPATSIKDAAALMLAKRIGCLPVTADEQCVVGIITRVDLLRHLVSN
jgi:CBS domain-containing protein